MAFSLIDLTDEFMIRQKISLPRRAHLYPSEASVKWTDENGEERTAGGCLRSTYYRLMGEVVKAPPNVYAEWIFSLGNGVERYLIEQWKQMGIYVAEQVEFYEPKYNLSGKIDCVVKDPNTGKLVCVEIKSMYGYNANRDIVGNTKQKGRPKVNQLLQLVVYLYLFRDKFPSGKMIYYSRDSANRAEFNVRLVDTPGGTRIYVNEEEDTRFYVEDCFNRYLQMMQYIDTKTLPPRDYEISFSPEKVERRKKLGEVSKSAYEEWTKGKRMIGDWQCSYCSFAKTCYSNKASLPKEEVDLDEIL